MSWKKNFLLVSLLLVSFIAFYGCGSDNKSSGAVSAVPRIGDTACVQCHSATADRITGESIVAQYQKSAHYNNDKAGCEGCHGGGAQHNGVGPIPYPKPDQARCATCHDGTTAPATSSAKWANSNHAIPYEETTGDPCYRCHTSEGAILSNILGYTGDKDGVLLNAAFRPVLDVDASKFTMGVNCEACHQHGGKLRKVMAKDASGNLVAWDPNKNRKVDEFDLCTSCHLFYNYDGTKLIASGKDFTVGSSTVSSLKHYHETAWYRTIASTHNDLPETGLGSGTGGSTSAKIEGYVVRKNANNPCLECHGHDFKTNTRVTTPARPATIYTDWAKSAHAGKLLVAKYSADNGTRSQDTVNNVIMAGVVDDTAAAWSHYDWDSKARRDCQRCHTSTGASNFLSNPGTYDPKNNNFSHLAGWSINTTSDTVVSSQQNELLYCWGCHKDAGKGELRNPGALTFNYSNNATVTYPDVKGSNVCMACHTGRETGDSIKNSFTNYSGSFINSHYLSAGGQLFGTTGYEYAGKDYSNPPYFKHDKIGITEALTVTKNGPCIGCHMSSDNSHLFTNVKKDNTGAITEITSKVCASCHTGTYALTPAKLTKEEEDYQSAIKSAMLVMASKGVYFKPAHPYWYKSNLTSPFTLWYTVYGLDKWKDVMGAAFNINLLAHDPGGYAHNRYYVKRLLWDSIDFMEDGTLGNVDMANLIDGLKGKSYTYILNNVSVTVSLSDAEIEAAKAYLGTSRP